MCATLSLVNRFIYSCFGGTPCMIRCGRLAVPESVLAQVIPVAHRAGRGLRFGPHDPWKPPARPLLDAQQQLVCRWPPDVARAVFANYSNGRSTSTQISRFMIQFEMLVHPFRNAPKPPASPPPPIWIGWISAAATPAVVLRSASLLCAPVSQYIDGASWHATKKGTPASIEDAYGYQLRKPSWIRQI